MSRPLAELTLDELDAGMARVFGVVDGQLSRRCSLDLAGRRAPAVGQHHLHESTERLAPCPSSGTGRSPRRSVPGQTGSRGAVPTTAPAPGSSTKPPLGGTLRDGCPDPAATAVLAGGHGPDSGSLFPRTDGRGGRPRSRSRGAAPTRTAIVATGESALTLLGGRPAGGTEGPTCNPVPPAPYDPDRPINDWWDDEPHRPATWRPAITALVSTALFLAVLVVVAVLLARAGDWLGEAWSS